MRYRSTSTMMDWKLEIGRWGIFARLAVTRHTERLMLTRCIRDAHALNAQALQELC